MKEIDLGHGHTFTNEIVFEEVGTAKQVMFGPTADKRELYIAYQTRRGDHDMLFLDGRDAAKLGGKIQRWAGEMTTDGEEKE